MPISTRPFHSVADARVAIEELTAALPDYAVAPEYRARVARFQADWDREVERLFGQHIGPPLSQSEVIGLVNTTSHPKDVVVCAAGSLPGDLHNLWRTRDPRGYHLSTVIHAWDTKSPAGSVRNWPHRNGRFTYWSATARI